MPQLVSLPGFLGKVSLELQLTSDFLALFVSVNGSNYSFIEEKSLEGANLCSSELARMMKNVVITREAMENGKRVLNGEEVFRFSFSGGAKIVGPMTIRPTFSFLMDRSLIDANDNVKYTVCRRGWNPHTSQRLKALQHFLEGSDRTVDITEFYFRSGWDD